MAAARLALVLVREAGEWRVESAQPAAAPASPPALRSRRVRAAAALAGLAALGVGYACLEYRAFTKAALALLVAAQLTPVVFDAV